MKFLASALLFLIPLLAFAQKETYTPVPPQYKINNTEILYEGYILNPNGAKAYTEKREYVGFCFNYKAPFPVIKETDSLVMVALSAPYSENDYTFFWVSKKSFGTETAIPLDNFDLNERYVDREWWHNSKVSSEQNCGEQQTNYGDEENQFTGDEYPDVVVTLIPENEFLKMKSSATDYLTIDKSINKISKTITIGGKKFIDDLGEGNLPNTYTYIGDYKVLNASLLQYTCEACEEYSYELIDKRTGKQIASFTNVPVFSKDYKYVMDLGQLFSSNPTILFCYKWEDLNKSEIPSTYKEFVNWSPVGKGFWGKDNCFYTPVVPTITIDNHNADVDNRTTAAYNFRYVKITIKGLTPKQED